MRSSGLRRVGCARSISRNPVTLPMLHLGSGSRHERRRMDGRSINSGGALDAENPLVLVREDFDELRLGVGPVLENPRSARAAGEIAMACEQALHALNVGGVDERFEVDAGLVAAADGEVAPIVVNVGDAAAHA